LGFCCLFFLENRGEFLEKLQRVRSQVKAGVPSQCVLTHPSPTRIMVGNWSLACKKEGELTIHNSDGQQQATILKEDLPGFIFESNRGTKHSFTAETSLGAEFAAGWTGRKSRKLRSKMEAVKIKVGCILQLYLYPKLTSCN
jgi:E3 ubiquitin-protein ligase HECTD1